MRQPAEKKPTEFFISQTCSNSKPCFPCTMLTSHRTLLKMLLEEAMLKASDWTKASDLLEHPTPPSLNHPDTARWEMGHRRWGEAWGTAVLQFWANSAPRVSGMTKWICGHSPPEWQVEATQPIMTILQGLLSHATWNKWPFHVILQSQWKTPKTVTTLKDNFPIPYKTGKGLYWSDTVAWTSSSARGTDCCMSGNMFTESIPNAT